MHPASRPGPGDPGNGSAGRWGRRDCVDGTEKPWDWTSLSEVVKSPGWPGGTVELRSPTSPLAYNDGSDLDAPAGYLKAPCSVNAALSREKKHLAPQPPLQAERKSRGSGILCPPPIGSIPPPGDAVSPLGTEGWGE